MQAEDYLTAAVAVVAVVEAQAAVREVPEEEHQTDRQADLE